ncbi:pyridine nucleotide-disulfide oxidoreductase [Streptomyces kaniharaensis]|uniref:Pyridine nucleotide-disulfide oxidoreductase n=1 Tax=Streptomyces kaniharaensis TaxID=212423 RepID=A0A6N7KPA1_9ACTN|nr:FAD-dependent oxidoreductase [Streptomyces kaniharaensis]MQS12167.1 pyridine nucleotide-disulfide oxidoreductase [Streptomyces kaniharaensis]
MSSTTEKRIVVLGAGYAGLTAAKGAGRHHTVTLVAPEERLLHRVRQHEAAAGHGRDWPAIDRLARGRRIEHRRARAVELDLAGHKVLLDDGTTLGYDTLVYALGSRTAWHDVPGAAEHAYSAERAADLHRRLRDADRPGTLAVVGGGATGIELATELAEAHPGWRVRIVAAGRVGGIYSPKGRAHIRRVLDRLGVTVHENATVTEVSPAGLRTTAGPIDADVTVWAASMEPHPLAAEAGLAVDDRGRALVDDHLRSVSHPDVHVVGDAAAVTVPGIGTLRMGCATALPQGQYLGKLLDGRTAKPFAYKYVVQCLSLGRRDGLLQLVRGDDSMRPTVLTGAAGRMAKAAIVTGVLSALK